MSRRWASVGVAIALGLAIGCGSAWFWQVRSAAGEAAALPTACLNVADRPQAPGAGMIWIPGGRFKMGAEQYRAEEAPIHEVAVDGFWIDSHDVTNAQFQAFVTA